MDARKPKSNRYVSPEGRCINCSFSTRKAFCTIQGFLCYSITMSGLRSLDPVASSLATVAVISYSVVLIYRYIMHPLKQYPGPLLAKVTDMYAAYFAIRMDIHLKTYEDHLRYGPVLRHGPNKLIFNSVQAMQDIYLDDSVFKSSVYALTNQGRDIWNIFNVIDKKLSRAKRRAIGQAFSPLFLRKFEPTIHEQTDVFLKGLLGSIGGPVNMTERCQRLSVDVIGFLAFGYPFSTQTIEDNRFMFRAFELSSWKGNVFMQFPPLRNLLRVHLLYSHFNIGIRERFMRLVEKMIQSRLGQDSGSRSDLYSLLSEESRRVSGGIRASELWSEALIFITAGGDTITVAMSALFFYLSRNKACYIKLADEVRSAFKDGKDIKGGPSLSGCRYLRACIDEALRLSPPVPGTLWREVVNNTKPWIVDGHVIPKGVRVGVCCYALQHNPEYFPEPFRYHPDRWLCPDTSTEAMKRMRAAFVPFSIGSRACIGRDLAYLELSLVMAKTLWYFDFETAPGKAGDLGAGGRGRSGLRSRADEFQLNDNFAATHDGPNLVFSPYQRLEDANLGQSTSQYAVNGPV
ncbi:cytochrome P450 [Xylariaceae sp. FL0016]|nr:cytochrome P450 [Xylariaceae sp. FL0016]